MTTFSTDSRARLRRARPSGPGRTRAVGAGSTRSDALKRSGECRTVGGRDRGESRRSWRGSLARCLSRDSAPARAAARTAVTPHPPPARPPAVTHPQRPRLHRWQGRPPRAGHPKAAQRSQSRSYVLAALRALHLDSDLPRQNPAPISRTNQTRLGDYSRSPVSLDFTRR